MSSDHARNGELGRVQHPLRHRPYGWQVGPWRVLVGFQDTILHLACMLLYRGAVADRATSIAQE